VRERCFAVEVVTTDIGAIRRHTETWCRDVACARRARDDEAGDELPHMQAPQRRHGLRSGLDSWSVSPVRGSAGHGGGQRSGHGARRQAL